MPMIPQKKLGRPDAGFFSAEEAAKRLDMPLTLLLRKLKAPGRSFFLGATEENGHWSIPERDLRKFMERSMEQLYSMHSAAEMLALSYYTVVRAVNAGKIAVVDVLGEPRIRESALAALLTARKPGAGSFFARKRRVS